MVSVSRDAATAKPPMTQDGGGEAHITAWVAEGGMRSRYAGSLVLLSLREKPTTNMVFIKRVDLVQRIAPECVRLDVNR